MTSKHTSGPWQRQSDALRGGTYWTVIRPGSDDPIDIHEDDNGEADSALISAGPDMLAALKIAEVQLNAMDRSGMSCGGELRQVREAIANAEGRS